MKQIIAVLTRITPKTQSVIDIILVFDTTKIGCSGVMDYCISDHCLIYLYRKVRKTKFNGHNTISVRLMKYYC